MTTSVGKILDSFLDPIITLIIGSPTHKYLVEIFDKINWNVASIQKNLGGGGLSYLALTVKPDIYYTLSATAFAYPTNPWAAP